jgi:hypothetical protein
MVKTLEELGAEIVWQSKLNGLEDSIPLRPEDVWVEHPKVNVKSMEWRDPALKEIPGHTDESAVLEGYLMR